MNSKLILQGEGVVLMLIEPSTKHQHSPEVSYTQLVPNLCNIQWQRSQVMLPFLLNKSITGWWHSTKHDKSPSFKVQCNTPCQRIRRNPSNHLNQSFTLSGFLPTASFRCPLANRFRTSLPPHLPCIPFYNHSRNNSPTPNKHNSDQNFISSNPRLQALPCRWNPWGGVNKNAEAADGGVRPIYASSLSRR